VSQQQQQQAESSAAAAAHELVKQHNAQLASDAQQSSVRIQELEALVQKLDDEKRAQADTFKQTVAAAVTKGVTDIVKQKETLWRRSQSQHVVSQSTGPSPFI
jgi:hypothetical protein